MTGKRLNERIEKDKVEGLPEQQLPLSAKIEKSHVRKRHYVMDLRIHSPAALGYFGIEGIDTAPALVRLAKVKGLDVIGITDFYHGRFVDRMLEAAKDTPLIVIPGVDIRCTVGHCDDITISCFFAENQGSSHIGEFLDLLQIPRTAEGDHTYLVRLPFERVLQTIESFGAAALPSRIDKTPHRMAAIPLLVEEYGFRAFEIAYPEDSSLYFKRRWPKIKFRLFSFSNANALAQIGSRIAKVKLAEPGFEGIKQIVQREASQTMDV